MSASDFEEMLVGIFRGVADLITLAESYDPPERDQVLPPIETEAMFRLEDRLASVGNGRDE